MLIFPFAVFIPSAAVIYYHPQAQFAFIPLPSVIVASEPSNYIFGIATIFAFVSIISIGHHTFKFLRGKNRYSRSLWFSIATYAYMAVAVGTSIALAATAFFNVTTDTKSHFLAKGFFFGLSFALFFSSDALLSTCHHRIPVGFWAADIANLLVVIVYIAGESYVIKQDNTKKISPVSLIGYLAYVTVFIRYFFQRVLLRSVTKSSVVKVKLGAKHKN